MTRVFWAALLVLLAKPAQKTQPLPSLPVVSRVRVDAARDHVLVTQDIVVSRGEWSQGDIDLYVAFGAVVPRAFDARLVAVADGSFGPDANDAGEPVPTERATRKPQTAHLLLGRSMMAGEVVHVREPAFRRAVSGTGRAALRLRTLFPLPPADGSGVREVLVRLGTEGAAPLAVARIEVSAIEQGWVKNATAHMCGPEADPYPLAVAVTPTAQSAPSYPLPTAPLFAVRHTSDDLCVAITAP